MSRLNLVLVVGPSGTGKSILARKIARKTGFVYVDSEEIKKKSGYRSLHTLSRSESREKAYQALRYQLSTQLRLGNSVVTDAPHNLEMRDHGFVQRFLEALKAWDIDARIHIIHCQPPMERIRRNLEKRFKRQGRPADAHKLQNWAAFAKGELERFSLVHPHLTVNPNDSQVVHQVVTYLER